MAGTSAVFEVADADADAWRYDRPMRPISLVIVLAMAVTSCGAPPSEQAAAPVPAVTPAPASPPPDAVRLIPGMGSHHHAIATTSPEAQRYFDQGVNLVFGFNHEEAVRSFTRAAELD